MRYAHNNRVATFVPYAARLHSRESACVCVCAVSTVCSDGSIRIKGDAVPVGGGDCQLNGCPAAVGFLYVYKGTTISPANLVGTGNQQNVDTTVTCSKGEIFQICEQNGVMITSSVKFTFTGQTTGSCNMLGTGNNWIGLGCTP